MKYKKQETDELGKAAQEAFRQNKQNSIVKDDTETHNVLDYTREIVSAYVGNTQLAAEEIVPLIESVYATLDRLQEDQLHRQLGSQVIENQDKHQRLRSTNRPAVPIEDSIHDDYVICLEDGKKLKTLRRHLKAAFGMTPEDYRHRWGLSDDYPMVAPNYSKRRSELANQIGLGKNK